MGPPHITLDFFKLYQSLQKDPKTIAKEHTSNITVLIKVLEENLFQTKNYNLRRWMKRIIDSLKS
jgi:hypothetical protein